MPIQIKVTDHAGLKKFITVYKGSKEYRTREKQTAFCGFARSIIGDLKNNRPGRHKWDNKDLTALINIFKCPNNPDSFQTYRFERNLKKLEFEAEVHQSIMKAFHALPPEALGYTGAGRKAIPNLLVEDVDKVRIFLEGLYSASTVTEIKALVVEFQKEDISLVKAGIYSPWAHYLHPTICPIVNKKSKRMLKEFHFSWKGDYAVAIDVFTKLGRTFGMEDLGLVDRLVASARLRAGLEKLIQIKE